jgi:uncharacterized protein YjiS (DUF1127 family)
MEVAMSTLNKSTKTARPSRLSSLRHVTQGFANWSRRARSRKELMNLSDRGLNDIGIARQSSGLKACKPFWMA